jgi:hypothetical protein
LSGKVLNLAVRKGDKAVALKKVEDALAQEIHDYTDVASVIEAVSQVDAAIPVFLVVGLERGQNAKLDSRSIAVFLDGSNDLDSHRLVPLQITGLHYFAKSALSKKTNDLILNNTVSHQRSIKSLEEVH